MSCLSRLWQSGKRKLLNRPSKKFQKFISSGLTLAELRHTAGSLLLNNGMSVKQIAEYLGHEKVSTTLDIYAHIDFEGKRATAQAMGNIFKNS